MILCTKKSALLGLGNLMAGISRPGALGVSLKIAHYRRYNRWFVADFLCFDFDFGFYGRFISLFFVQRRLSARNLPEILFLWLKAHVFFPPFSFLIQNFPYLCPCLSP